jgi:hypothetical protein
MPEAIELEINKERIYKLCEIGYNLHFAIITMHFFYI